MYKVMSMSLMTGFSALRLSSGCNETNILAVLGVCECY